MCHERFLRGWHRDDAESRELWADFDRTRPVVDLEPPVEVAEDERPDDREELATTER